MADPQKDFLMSFVASCNLTLGWAYGIPEREIPKLINVINETLAENNINDTVVRLLPETDKNPQKTFKKEKETPEIQILIKKPAQRTRVRQPSF